MPRYNKRNRPKKQYIQLEYPFRAYSSIKEARRDNPGTKKADWHKFDSLGEYERFKYLLACQNDGDISNLVPHPMTIEILPQLKIPPNGIRPDTRSIQRRVYTPDFRYQAGDVTVFEDYKGYKATSYDNLRHGIFIRSLIQDYGWDAKDFHFKVVTDAHANPFEE